MREAPLVGVLGRQYSSEGRPSTVNNEENRFNLLANIHYPIFVILLKTLMTRLAELFQLIIIEGKRSQEPSGH